jgi:S1-C subfamily serine protease
VELPYMGVTSVPVTEQLAEDLNLPVDHGALVQEVQDGTPADKAGLRGGSTPVGGGDLAAGGDLIVEVDGHKIAREEDLAVALADNRPGDRVVIKYFRGDDRREARLRLTERPSRLPGSGPSVGRPLPGGAHSGLGVGDERV